MKNMKVLFFSAAIKSDTKNSGVIKKVLGQVSAFRRLGCSVDSVILEDINHALIEYSDGKKEVIETNHSTIRAKSTFLLEKMLEPDNKYDLVYIRLPGMSPKLLEILKKIHKSGSKIVIEAYTYPIVIERLKSAKRKLIPDLKGAIREFISTTIDAMLYPCLKKSVNYISTYSPHKYIWGIETISLSNGIDFSKEVIIERSPKQTKEINLITTANISYWHGYDRLIKGLRNYYDNEHEWTVVFHIVGDGPEKNNLGELVNQLELNNYVKFYGVKTGKELDAIYNDKDLGIASLAMHRKNSLYTSELKIREYFAKGLPFIIGTRDYSLENETANKFYLSFSADESDIDINRIVKFYNEVYCIPDIAEKMREYGLHHYDWTVQIQKIINKVNKI